MIERGLRALRLDLIHVVVFGMVAILSALVVHYVSVNVVNVPFYDEWHNFAETAVATARGDLRLDLFFRQWNEHRPLVLYLYVVVMTWLTDWNITVMAYLHVVIGVFMVFAAALLISGQGRARADRSRLFIWTLIPVAALVLSLRMRQIWLWGMQIKWTTGFVCLLIGLLVVQRAPVGWRGVIGAVVGAVGFTYTLAYGLLAWGIFPVVLWCRGYRNWRHYALFFVVMALVCVQYFSGYDTGEIGVSDAGRGMGVVSNPLHVAWFAVEMIGSPFVPLDEQYAIPGLVIGAFGLALFSISAVIQWRRERSLRHVSIWAALAGFSLASGLIIGLGRAHDFPEPYPHYPLVDRYTQPATMIWLALIGSGASNLAAALRPAPSPARRDRALVQCSVGVLALLMGAYAYTAHITPHNLPFVLPPGAACVRAYPVERNLGCMTGLFIPYPDFDYLERVPTLNDLSALRLTAWSDPAIPVPYSDIIELHDQPFTVDRQDGTAPEWGVQEIDTGWGGVTLSMEATSQITVALTLPATAAPLTFKSAGYLDLTDNGADAGDGVTFRVAVVAADGSLNRLFEQRYDPLTRSDTLPISADLSPYQGQTIDLIIQVGGGTITSDNDAIWLDPRIEVGVLP